MEHPSFGPVYDRIVPREFVEDSSYTIMKCEIWLVTLLDDGTISDNLDYDDLWYMVHGTFKPSKSSDQTIKITIIAQDNKWYELSIGHEGPYKVRHSVHRLGTDVLNAVAEYADDMLEVK